MWSVHVQSNKLTFHRMYNINTTECSNAPLDVYPAKNVLQFTMVNYGKSIVNHSKL